MPSIDLANRVCLVVGGAGGGIGTAIVLAAAEAGADVAAITNVADHAVDTEERVLALGRRCATAVADVTDEQALIDAVACVRRDLGTVRHLVNVVGGNLPEEWFRAVDYNMEAFDRLLARNLRYAIVSCREVARDLIAAGLPGSIVNMSSVGARGMPLLGAYGAAKAGLESFSRTMALEWAPRRIRVNLIAPGTIRTPRAGAADLSEDVANFIPLRRRGDPSDIANAALFLLSDLAGYITGQTVVVDGGSSLGGMGGDDLPPLVTNPVVRARLSR
jgi:NAD(P)-dependent dehydrogenase (short-subunit alcohol dehydrogenase family)